MVDNTFFKLFIITLFSYFSIKGVEGIYCFQCNSYHDPDCFSIQPNDTSSRFYKPCESHDDIPVSEFFCRKIIQTIFDRDGVQRVIRRCGWIRHHSRECYHLANKGHEDIVCQCFIDGCNGSTKQFVSLSLMSILATGSTVLGAIIRI